MGMLDSKGIDAVIQPKQIVCPNHECGCRVWDRKFLLGEVSAIQSPTGHATLVTEPVFVCVKCGTVLTQKQLSDKEGTLAE